MHWENSIGAALVAFAVAMTGTPRVQGQGVESIRQGARVRLQQVDGKRMSGILAGHGPVTVWVRFGQPGTFRAVPLAFVRRLEVSRERRSNAGRMALAGLVVGAIPGRR